MRILCRDCKSYTTGYTLWDQPKAKHALDQMKRGEHSAEEKIFNSKNDHPL